MLDFEYAHKKKIVSGYDDMLAGPLSDLNDAFAKIGDATVARADFCPYKERAAAGVAALESLSMTAEMALKEYRPKQ